ncbi:MAG: hypothetical protein ACRDNE_00620 [Gaiellaceae bacterium]
MTVVRWQGDEIIDKVEGATPEAIDETTQAAAEAAQQSHWWTSRSGQLESEIRSEPAQVEGSIVIGKFGTTMHRGFYGLFLERRTPFLRPGADQEFPKLAERIRDRLD